MEKNPYFFRKNYFRLKMDKQSITFAITLHFNPKEMKLISGNFRKKINNSL